MNTSKKIFHNLLGAMLAAVLLSSCTNNIPIDLGQFKPILTVNTLINCNSPENVIKVYLSSPERVVEDAHAEVKATVNDTTQILVPYSEKERAYILTHKFHPRDKVRLTVKSKDGKHSVWAEDRMPEQMSDKWSIKVDSVKEYPFYREGDDETHREDAYKYNFSLQDMPGENNYYRLVDSLKYWNNPNNARGQLKLSREMKTPYISYMDPIIMEGNTYNPTSGTDFSSNNETFNKFGVFSNKLFQGGKTHFTVYDVDSYRFINSINDYEASWHNDNLIIITANMERISEAMYYYMKVANKIESVDYDDDNPFSSAIKVPSNIHGGAGIMGLYTTSTKVIIKRFVKKNSPYNPVP